MNDNCIFIIMETVKFDINNEKPHRTVVCGALNEEEAKHKVKFLKEHARVSSPFTSATVDYEYHRIPCEITTSWLVDLVE